MIKSNRFFDFNFVKGKIIPFTKSNSYSLYIILKEKSTLRVNFINKNNKKVVKKSKLRKILIMEGEKKTKSRNNGLKVVVGLVAGLINGLFGGGGGMVVVPCLKYLLKYETDSAHATAIAVILPLSVLSGIFYAAFGNFEYEPAVFTVIGVTVGGIFGALMLKKLSSKPLTLIFSTVMAVAGVKMLLF